MSTFENPEAYLLDNLIQFTVLKERSRAIADFLGTALVLLPVMFAVLLLRSMSAVPLAFVH